MAELPVTLGFARTCAFLGLDHAAWVRRFGSLPEMFSRTTSSAELIVHILTSRPDFEAWVLSAPQEEIDALILAMAARPRAGRS